MTPCNDLFLIAHSGAADPHPHLRSPPGAASASASAPTSTSTSAPTPTPTPASAPGPAEPQHWTSGVSTARSLQLLLTNLQVLQTAFNSAASNNFICNILYFSIFIVCSFLHRSQQAFMQNSLSQTSAMMLSGTPLHSYPGVQPPDLGKPQSNLAFQQTSNTQHIPILFEPQLNQPSGMGGSQLIDTHLLQVRILFRLLLANYTFLLPTFSVCHDLDLNSAVFCVLSAASGNESALKPVLWTSPAAEQLLQLNTQSQLCPTAGDCSCARFTVVFVQLRLWWWSAALGFASVPSSDPSPRPASQPQPPAPQQSALPWPYWPEYTQYDAAFQ